VQRAFTTTGIADVRLASRRAEEALMVARRAVEMARKLGLRVLVGQATISAAKALRALGQLRGAHLCT
jgi:hypothetical protein